MHESNREEQNTQHGHRSSRRWMMIGAVIFVLAIGIGQSVQQIQRWEVVSTQAGRLFESLSTAPQIDTKRLFGSLSTAPQIDPKPDKPGSKKIAVPTAKNKTRQSKQAPAPKPAPATPEEKKNEEKKLEQKNSSQVRGLRKEKEVKTADLPKSTDGYDNPNTIGWRKDMSTADPDLFRKASKMKGDGKAQKIMLDPFRYPTARCNDGTQGLFYYAPPTKAKDDQGKPDDYIVMLEGGGWCSDVKGCKNRMKNSKMTSSRGDGLSRGMGGCLSTTDEKNPFLRAHKVFLRYCSSDGFAGNRDASDPLSGGLHFRGAVIVASVIQELVRTFGLVSGDSLFLGGFSAGARGAMFNMDYAPLYLPPDVRVVGLLDSPFWLDIQPWTLARSCAGVLAMANATGVVGEKCRAALPEQKDQWKCLLGQYRMHYLEHPYVIAAAQYDGYQMGVNNGGMNKLWKNKDDPDKLKLEKQAYREAFAKQTRDELRSLPAQAGSVFSTTCGNHVTSSGGGLWSIYIQNENTTKAWNLQELFGMAREHKFGVSVIADCPKGRECKGCWSAGKKKT